MSSANFPQDSALIGQRWRAVGLDVGKVRIGVAVSDPDRILATPVETIQRGNDSLALERIAQLIVEYEPCVLIVGKPYELSGKAGIAVHDLTKFVAGLEDYLKDNGVYTNIYYNDERLSTVTATRQLQELGYTSRSSRRIIDQIAAVMILQNWLDQYKLCSDKEIYE